MQTLYGKKSLPLGILFLCVLLVTSCNKTPTVQPPAAPSFTSTVVSGQPTKVVRLATPTPDGTVSEKLSGSLAATNEAPSLPDVAVVNDIQIRLEQVEEIESGYILKGKISKVPGLWLMVLLGEGTQLLDAKGGIIPTKYYFDGTGGTVQDPFADWGLQTIGKDYPGPWSLNVPSLLIELSKKVSFVVDLGPTPQLGQSLDLNRSIDFAGYKFLVQKVELFQSEKDRPCLNFLFAGGPEIFRVGSLSDPQNFSGRSDGHVSDAPSGVLSNSFCYDQMPAGIRSFNIYSVSIIQQGPWTLHWQPTN